MGVQDEGDYGDDGERDVMDLVVCQPDSCYFNIKGRQL